MMETKVSARPNEKLGDTRTLSARYIDRLYELVSPIYSAWVSVGSLGAFPGVYRSAAATLRLRAGETVFDLCCGTGLMLPYLAAAVGPEGRVVGIDRSLGMLRQAQLLSERHGIKNVDFIHSDLAQFRPEQPMDAAIVCIALSCIPDCETILQGLMTYLKPGGRIVVVDAFINEGRWYFAITNLYNRIKGFLIQAHPDNGIRQVLRRDVVDYEEKLVHLGMYAIVSGARGDGSAVGPA
jgi:ubiquinone/menaquinone biosynthesis C-methylase UbiE